jgi:hypothetical protein
VFPIGGIDLDTEYSIRQRFCYRALNFNGVAFGHTILSQPLSAAVEPIVCATGKATGIGCNHAGAANF